jgi:hypothetical protein
MLFMLGTPEIYKSLEESKFGRIFRDDAQNAGYIAEFQRQILAITPFGFRLCELCIGRPS